MPERLISWSRYPSFDVQGDEKPRSLLRSHDGRFIVDGPVDRPGASGFMLFVDGIHVETHERQREAKLRAEEYLAHESWTVSGARSRRGHWRHHANGTRSWIPGRVS